MRIEKEGELKQRFFDGMSFAACTVNVVTTDGPSGRAGVTVSAMASVSADAPGPSLLVCVHHKSPAAAAILGNRVFCVNVLRDDQSRISDTFAGRIETEAGDKFSCTTWVAGTTGAPRASDPLVAFDCRLLSSEQVGTHWVFFGAVDDVFISESGSPLIYANRAYGTSVAINPPPAQLKTGEAEELRLGCFRTFGPYLVPELIARMMAHRPFTVMSLQEGNQRDIEDGLHKGETEIALLYDLDLRPGLSLELMTEIHPYVLLPQEHGLAAKPKLSVHDLVDEPFVLLDAPSSREYFLSIFEAAGVEPNIRFRSSSFEMVRGLVGHGLGFSLLATKPSSNMTYDGRAVSTVKLDCDVGGSRVVLAYRKDVELSPAAQVFAEHCRAFFDPANH